MMLDKIVMILLEECHLPPSDKSLVGLSGGPDSVYLLHVLHQLAYPIVAVYVNHKLRPEADQEAHLVAQFTRNLGVEFISCQVDVLSYACAHSLSTEEAARILRYQVLFEQAGRINAKAVIVAHNADDQVETILMHVLRGSGLSGLRGMEYYTLPNPWSEHIPLVRPLLSTWRKDILEYLIEHGLRFISDMSNEDTKFLRNRIRHDLLPILEKYNPRIRHNLLRMSQISKDDYEVINQQVAAAWVANLLEQGQGYIALRLAGFRQLSTAIQRYMLRRAIAYHMPELRDIDFDSIERGVKFLCEDQTHGQVDLIAGLRLIKEGKRFWLASWQADLPGSNFPAAIPGIPLNVNIPGTLPLNEAWNMQIKLETDPEQPTQRIHHNIDPFQAWLDLEQLELPLIVRCRRPGERFTPLGMEGHSIKVSDLMVNLKMPVRARRTWPLVCSGDAIVWIPGYRQANLGRINPDSRSIVHLVLSRISPT